MPTSPQRQSRLYAIKEHVNSHILMLTEEVNLFLDHPVGVAGHPDYFKSIEDKIAEIAEYEGILTALTASTRTVNSTYHYRPPLTLTGAVADLNPSA